MKIIVAWRSGGVTSAVACKLAIDLFGVDNTRIIMIDTFNEHEDTYRFKKDCEVWYGKEIETITGIGDKYHSIEDVWRKRKSLNTATGAICSTELKRYVREKWEKSNHFDAQVFGFEFESNEFKRSKSMKLNNPKSLFPLLMYGLTKKDCIEIVQRENIEVPVMYSLGFHNNNCFKTGCVQGGIGYWQKIQREFPDKFNNMAAIEHELTDLKGEPVTMLKDQSNDSKTKDKKEQLLFLKKHKDYPNVLCLADKPIREVKPLFECNGFCGVNDLTDRSSTENEINYKLF